MRLIKLIIVMFIVQLMVSGCAINRHEIQNRILARTDPISITDREEFQKAVEECAEYAARELQRVRDDQIGRAFMGALLGAGAGYGISKIYGVGNRYTSANTVITAAGGAAGGAMSVMNPTDTLIYNCMTNRGFKMLY